MSVTIQTLREKFRSIVTQTAGLQTFIFDDLSKINTDQDKDYPVFLLKIPTKYYDTTKANDPNYKYYSFYNFDCFVFKPGSRDDDFGYDEIWATLEPMGRSVLDAIDRSNNGLYVIVSRVDIEYGHHEHNDMLYGVRYKFVLRVYDGC